MTVDGHPPEEGERKPVITFIVVDLPAPLIKESQNFPLSYRDAEIIDGNKLIKFFG